MAIEYRDAAESDAADIVAFQKAMARETENGLELDHDTVTRGVAAVFADASRGRYFVAAEGGRVVASLLITYEWSDWRNGVIWWIQSVYVVRELRGRGVYRGLYEHVKAMVDRDPSIPGIRLYVEQNNRIAQEVYRRVGMSGDHYLVFEWMK
jgi:ribosomal protein S18 acetylase RimI-like enzyme